MSQQQRSRQSQAALAIAALGVVYGDIGTSPLYTIKAVFDPSFGIPFSAQSILGGLSALFWSLMIVVSFKYVVLIMRADNEREGGIMALLALASASVKDHPNWTGPLMLLGAFGAPARVVMLLMASLKNSPSRAMPLVAWLVGGVAALLSKLQPQLSPTLVGAAVSIAVMGISIGMTSRSIQQERRG